jgi:hypothetical protein
MVNTEGVDHAGDISVGESEEEYEIQLHVIAEIGATDLPTSVLPTGEGAEATIAITRSALKSIVGEI